MLSTDSEYYTRTAKIFHWLIAAAIILMLVMGWTFDFFTGDTKFYLFQLHKSIGITILLLSLLRLIWRLMHKAPPLPPTMPAWEQRAAHVGHFFLYAAMILMPLSGWAMVSADSQNIPLILYGVLPFPCVPVLPELENRRAIAHSLGDMHCYLGYTLAALAAGHAAAALNHHFRKGDDILLRMAPRFSVRWLNRLRG